MFLFFSSDLLSNLELACETILLSSKINVSSSPSGLPMYPSVATMFCFFWRSSVATGLNNECKIIMTAMNDDIM